MCCHIVEMNILISPFKIVDDALVRQLILNNKNILEEVNNPFLDIEVVELGNHCLLVLKISFILVDESISFIDYVSYIVKDCDVLAHV